MFKIGDKIVCVQNSGTNWYSVGDVHVVSSKPIEAYCDEQREDYIAFNVKAHSDKNVWIDARDFKLVEEDVAFTQEHYAAAFNMWMDQYTNNPSSFESSYDTAMRHVSEKLNGEEPSYGQVCSELFQEYLNKTLEEK